MCKSGYHCPGQVGCSTISQSDPSQQYAVLNPMPILGVCSENDKNRNSAGFNQNILFPMANGYLPITSPQVGSYYGLTSQG